MRNVGFFLCPGFQILDLGGPFGALETASVIAGKELYALALLSEKGGMVKGSGGTMISTVRAGDAALDTLILVGGDTKPMFDPQAVKAALTASGSARRTASVCTGAFLLAETGLLDGRRATTHWAASREFQQRYPKVRLEADRIYVHDGGLWTSAGVTAGIDLALALVEVDQGVDLARAVARKLVVPHRRSGGQSQFSEASVMDPDSDRIRRALAFARDHLSEKLPMERLAQASSLSMRQFGRAFRKETGETPARAVERLRVEAAIARLRDGAEPVEQIAASVGFHDPERMRRAFLRIHGMGPQSFRRIHRSGGSSKDLIP